MKTPWFSSRVDQKSRFPESRDNTDRCHRAPIPTPTDLPNQSRSLSGWGADASLSEVILHLVPGLLDLFLCLRVMAKGTTDWNIRMFLPRMD